MYDESGLGYALDRTQRLAFSFFSLFAQGSDSRGLAQGLLFELGKAYWLAWHFIVSFSSGTLDKQHGVFRAVLPREGWFFYFFSLH